MNLLESDIVIWTLCSFLLALILFLTYSLAKVLRSNVYHEKRIKRAERLFLKKKKKAENERKVKKFPRNYLKANDLLSANQQKSAS